MWQVQLLCAYSNSKRGFLTHLIQRSNWDLAHIIGDVLPGGALGIAGGHTMSVPQIAWNKGDLDIKRPAERHSLTTRAWESGRFTIVVDGVDGRPADRHLLQLLFWRGGDVVPAVSCGGGQSTSKQKRFSSSNKFRKWHRSFGSIWPAGLWTETEPL